MPSAPDDYKWLWSPWIIIHLKCSGKVEVVATSPQSCQDWCVVERQVAHHVELSEFFFFRFHFYPHLRYGFTSPSLPAFLSLQATLQPQPFPWEKHCHGEILLMLGEPLLLKFYLLHILYRCVIRPTSGLSTLVRWAILRWTKLTPGEEEAVNISAGKHLNRGVP